MVILLLNCYNHALFGHCFSLTWWSKFKMKTKKEVKKRSLCWFWSSPCCIVWLKAKPAMPGCCRNASDGAEERPWCWGSGDGWEDAFLCFSSGIFALHLFLVWSRIHALCHAGVIAGSDPQLLGCLSIASTDVGWSWDWHGSFGTGFFILCVNAGQCAQCVGTLQVFHGTPGCLDGVTAAEWWVP